jgi:hypothetical protein
MIYLEAEEAKAVILLSPVKDRPISWLVEEMLAVELLHECKKAA